MTNTIANLNTLQVFEKNPLKKTYSESENSSEVKVEGQPNTALLSTIMVLGTFLVAFYLRKFRTSYFFGKKVGNFFSCYMYMRGRHGGWCAGLQIE